MGYHDHMPCHVPFYPCIAATTQSFLSSDTVYCIHYEGERRKEICSTIGPSAVIKVKYRALTIARQKEDMAKKQDNNGNISGNVFPELI